jgi:uncharacterized protein
MTCILAMSDTHLEGELPENLVRLAEGADIVVHAGDFISLEVYDHLSEISRLEAVCGNSDVPELQKALPKRKVFEVEGVRLGIVHMASHSSDSTGSGLLAREMEVDVLIFGHIHRPYVEQRKKLLICPGSPTFPRMSNPTVSQIVVESGEVKGTILTLGQPVCNYLKFAESLAKKDDDKD